METHQNVFHIQLFIIKDETASTKFTRSYQTSFIVPLSCKL